MGKTYIDTVKYLIYSNVDIDGLVEKPDVVGAIFGQTEGLLGDELDLRDLQKNGRIGRIEVDLGGREGRTQGVIKIPSSLDMVETCIIAAALETVDRIGPCEANIKVTKIEDTRNMKRKALIDRAKGLLKNLIHIELPESKEISELVRGEVKAAEIEEYGRDRLPAGPNIDKTNEVIFVEGRADVINLLKNDITNVVAIQGAKVTQTIIELSKQKEVTVFLDGDRGGDIILNELVQGGADIDFVARAPSGKEVEELQRKELIKCLRSKVPFESGAKESEERGGQRGGRREREGRDRREEREQPRVRYEEQFMPRRMEQGERKEQNDPRDRPEPRERQEVRERFEPREAPRETRAQAEQFAVKESLPAARPRENLPMAPVERPSVSARTLEGPVERPSRTPDVAPAPQESGMSLVKVSKEDLMKELEELNNSLKARLYNSNFERVREIQVRDVIKTLEEVNDAKAIVFDGIITQRLVDLANSKGVKTLVGVKIGNVNKKPEGLEIITKVK